MSREFSPTRLYKLVKIFVIIITVLSIVLAIFYKLETIYGYEQYSKEVCPNIENAEGYVLCMDFARDQWLENHSKYKFWRFIAIGLPVVFFGTSAIYKYIFPKKR